MNHHSPPPRIAGRYQLGRKIGSGSFGEIHYGVDSNGQEIAIKMESLKKKTGHLLYESRLYKLLQGGLGIPNVYYYGCEDEYAVMVMDLLGPSLEELFVYCGRRFRLKTVCMLADQMLQRMEFVHTLGVIHRDIKPHNFLIGRQNRAHIVHIIDFGLAKRFKDPNTGQHIDYVENRNLTGTARYVSINTHLGCEQSRRDDIESLAYVIIYFIRTTLPWQGLKAQSKKDKYERIMDIKISTPLSELCQDYPVEFQLMLTYCRQLGFVDRPDYSFLRRLMKELLFREGFLYDFNFDWVSHSDYNTVTNPGVETTTFGEAEGATISAAAKTESSLVGNEENSVEGSDKNNSQPTEGQTNTTSKGEHERREGIDHQKPTAAQNTNKNNDLIEPQSKANNIIGIDNSSQQVLDINEQQEQISQQSDNNNPVTTTDNIDDSSQRLETEEVIEEHRVEHVDEVERGAAVLAELHNNTASGEGLIGVDKDVAGERGPAIRPSILPSVNRR